MRVIGILKSHLGALLLGVAMALLVAGFALFFMPPAQAVRSPMLWAFSLLTAVAVAAPSFIQRRACTPASRV